jgi:triacylglycerol esterase/lipase EstA (alpha/beta hydrolase family)
MPRKKATTTSKTTVTKPKSQSEKNDYTKLTDYIQAVYRKQGVDDPPWALLMTQVRNIIKNYGLSYIEILHILQYMVQIEEIDFSEKDTLGLVPYYINRTERYMTRYKEVKQTIKDFKFEEKTVTVAPNQTKIRYKKKNETFSD